MRLKNGRGVAGEGKGLDPPHYIGLAGTLNKDPFLIVLFKYFCFSENHSMHNKVLMCEAPLSGRRPDIQTSSYNGQLVSAQNQTLVPDLPLIL